MLYYRSLLICTNKEFMNRYCRVNEKMDLIEQLHEEVSSVDLLNNSNQRYTGN